MFEKINPNNPVNVAEIAVKNGAISFDEILNFSNIKWIKNASNTETLMTIGMPIIAISFFLPVVLFLANPAVLISELL